MTQRKERDYQSKNGNVVLVQACAVSCLTFGSPAAFPDTDSSDLTFPPSLVAVQIYLVFPMIVYDRETRKSIYIKFSND
jgi:hypothetical protein